MSRRLRRELIGYACMFVAIVLAASAHGRINGALLLGALLLVVGGFIAGTGPRE